MPFEVAIENRGSFLHSASLVLREFLTTNNANDTNEDG